MRGRKPKPTAQKVLEGNPGKRPLNAQEPEFPPPVDATPPELADNAHALHEWARLCPLLEAARVTTEADRGSLIALCLSWSQYLEATQKIRASGMVVKTPNDYPIPNPYIAIANRALGHCTKLWVELGLTPSSRSRVSTTPPVAWTGHSVAAKPLSKLAQLQERSAALRRPLAVAK